MSLREKLFSNRMLRLVIRGGDAITNYPLTKKGGFTPYFQYVIGRYQDDFYLYFPNEPTIPQYYNEIFNKMVCYYGNDAVQFVRFHYDSYSDKQAFLQFLFYELKHRNNRALAQAGIFSRSSDARISSIFECVSDWVTKQMEEHRAERKQNIYANLLRNDLTVIINNSLTEQVPLTFSNEELAKILEDINSQLDGFKRDIEGNAKDLLNAISDLLRNDFIVNAENNLIEQVLPAVATKIEQEIKEKNNALLNTMFDSFRNDFMAVVNSKLSKQMPATLKKISAEFTQALYPILDSVTEKLTEKAAETTREKLTPLVNTISNNFTTSNIVENVDDSNHVFVVVLLALQNYRIGNKYLFKDFTDVDIAKILRLHFEKFKANPVEVDTIRKNYLSAIKAVYNSTDFDGTRFQIDELLAVIIDQLKKA